MQDQEEFTSLNQLASETSIRASLTNSDFGDTIPLVKKRSSVTDQEGITFLGFILNPGVTKLNLIGWMMIIIIVDINVVQYGGLLQPMYENKDYFGMTNDEARNFKALTQALTLPFNFVMILFGGILYDTVGRRKVLTFSFILISLCTFLLPVVAPNRTDLLIVKCLTSIPLGPIVSIPLLPDYVHRKSIGKGTALVVMLACTGVIIAMQVAIEKQKYLDPLIQYSLISIFFLAAAASSFFTVSESMDFQDKERSSLKTSIKEACLACKDDKRLLVGFILIIFISGPTYVFQQFTQVWLNSFIGEGKPISDSHQSLTIWQNLSTVGCFVNILILSIIGFISDKVGTSTMLPIVMLIRAFIWYFTFLINDPTHAWVFIIFPLNQAFVYAGKLLIDTHLNKMYPKNLRGIMASFSMSAFFVGQAFYGGILSGVAHLYNDNQMAFFAMVNFDMVLALVLAVLAYYGLLNTVKKGEEDHSSKAKERQEKIQGF